MGLLSALRELCVTYPITPSIQIICAIFCVMPTLFFQIAVLKSSIHPNCRMLLCLWGTAQLLVCGTVCWLSVHYIAHDEEFFKDTFDPSGTVLFILRCYVPCWIICTCFELGISLERGYSMLNPSKYHRSSAAYGSVLGYLICSLLITYQLSELLLSGSKTTGAMIGSVLSNLMDVGSFSTNIIVLLFARRKNKEEHKHLNERYQIRETYEIARAMLPVYCLSTALKVGIIIFNWLYVTRTLPHTLCELVYICFSELSCGLTSTMFLLYHVRLRSKVNAIFGLPENSSSIIDKIQNSAIDSHFEMMSLAWK